MNDLGRDFDQQDLAVNDDALVTSGRCRQRMHESVRQLPLGDPWWQGFAAPDVLRDAGRQSLVFVLAVTAIARGIVLAIIRRKRRR